MAQAKPNWAKIRARYERGGISQRDLAESEGVSYNTLKDRSTKEGWTVSRDVVHSKATAKTQQILIDYMAINQADVINLERESYLLIATKGRDLLAFADKAKDAKAAADTVRIGIEGLRHSLKMDAPILPTPPKGTDGSADPIPDDMDAPGLDRLYQDEVRASQGNRG